jgi:hypothetical protein
MPPAPPTHSSWEMDGGCFSLSFSFSPATIIIIEFVCHNNKDGTAAAAAVSQLVKGRKRMRSNKTGQN